MGAVAADFLYKSEQGPCLNIARTVNAGPKEHLYEPSGPKQPLRVPFNVVIPWVRSLEKGIFSVDGLSERTKRLEKYLPISSGRIVLRKEIKVFKFSRRHALGQFMTKLGKSQWAK